MHSIDSGIFSPFANLTIELSLSGEKKKEKKRIHVYDIISYLQNDVACKNVSVRQVIFIN